MKKTNAIIYLLLINVNIVCAQIRPLHTVVLILENHSYNQVVGNPLLPYINSILSDSLTAVFTRSFALGHPSQPNYIQLFSGASQGVSDNYVPQGIPFSTANLGAALIQKNFSFTGYAQGLPTTGSIDSSAGDYKRKHNPWVNWQGTGVNRIPSAQNKPCSSFPSDFSTLPTVAFVVPDQGHDMHDSTMEYSFPVCDGWIKANFEGYVQWCKKNNSLFIITFDEDDETGNNKVLTSITGENIMGGSYSQRITHYNVLRTIEDLYQLPYAGASKDSSAIKSIWRSSGVCTGGSSELTANLKGSIYQWQADTGNGFINLTDDINHAGTGTATLTLSNLPSSWYGRRYRCITDGNPCNSTNLRITSYFTGAINSSWENTANWSCGVLPDGNTDVFITTAVSLVLNSTATVRSFTLSGNAKFTNSSGKRLLITH